MNPYGYGGAEMGAFGLPGGFNPMQALQAFGGGQRGYATRYGFAQPAPYGYNAGRGGCGMPAPQSLMGAGRTLAIGFDSVAAVAAAGSAVITQRPQVRMQPSRVVIPSAIGGSFLVNDLKIGKNSQLTASSTLPAAVFAENAVGVALSMDPCEVAQDLTLNVTNISGAGVRFNAAMIGISCW